MGAIYLPAMVHVGFYFEKKRALATGIASCGGGIGCIILGPVIAMLIDKYNWQGAIWILAGFWFQCVAAGVLLIPVTPTIVKKYDDFGRGSRTESVSDVAIDDMIRTFTRQHSSRLATTPLHRSDLFYTGSFQILPSSAHTSRQSFLSPKNVHVKSTVSSEVENEMSTNSWMQSCVMMLDLSLLKSPTMLMVLLANVFAGLSIYLPFIYTTGMVTQMGASASSAGLLVTIVGISTIFSRLIYGWLADHVFTAISVTAGSLFVCGLATSLAGFLNSYLLVAIYMCVFGLTHGTHWSLNPVVVAESVGLEKLTNGMGLVFLVRGIFTVVSVPLGGALYEFFDSYKALYMYAGTLLMMSGLTYFVLNIMHRRFERSEKTSNN